MDIHAGLIAVAAFAVIAAYLALRAAIRIFRSARSLKFYSLRRQHTAGGWRLLVLTLLLLAAAYWLPTRGEEVAYRVFPPSPTPTRTPTVTVSPTVTTSPTITVSPTITDTPSATDTATSTSTPSVPLAIEAIFTSVITPNPDAILSAIEFSTEYDGVFAVDPQTIFQNPVGHLYGSFSYDGMIAGVQYTELWLHNDEIVCYETEPWDGTTGGYGFVDCNPPAHEWLPGLYEVQIFVGHTWMQTGTFIVEGDPPTASPTVTRTPRPTPSPTRTPAPSLTPSSTATRRLPSPTP